MCSGQERPQFLGDPHWPDQQINWSLEKRRVISFDLVPEEEQYPAAEEARRACLPTEKREKDDSRKNERDADSMENPVPPRTMFVVILAHVVR